MRFDYKKNTNQHKFYVQKKVCFFISKKMAMSSDKVMDIAVVYNQSETIGKGGNVRDLKQLCSTTKEWLTHEFIHDMIVNQKHGSPLHVMLRYFYGYTRGNFVSIPPGFPEHFLRLVKNFNAALLAFMTDPAAELLRDSMGTQSLPESILKIQDSKGTTLVHLMISCGMVREVSVVLMFVPARIKIVAISNTSFDES